MSKDIQEMVDHIISDTNYIASESKRYLDALGEIAVAGDQANAIYLIGIARAAIDGASTTADQFNTRWVSPNDPGDENDSSENRYHDTNAQIVAYDKSMEEE